MTSYIEHAFEGNLAEMQKYIKESLAEKVNAAIDEKKKSIASNLLKQKCSGEKE